MQRNLTIAFFSGTWDPTINGVITSEKTFAAGLEALGHRVYTFVPQTATFTKEANRVIPIQAIALPRTKDYYLLLTTNFLLTDLLHQIEARDGVRFDLIHAHHLFQVGVLARKVSKRLGIPAIATYHTLIEEYGHYFPFLSNELKRQLLRNHGRDVLNTMDHVITPSPSIRDLLQSQGVVVPMTPIPTGIHLEDYRATASDAQLRALTIDPKRRMILFAGRLAKEKNLGLLVEAFIKLRQVFTGHERPQLVFIGGGPQEAELRDDIISQGLSDDVVVTGMVDSDLLKTLFGGAYVFVHPSFTDTQAITIMEAMAAGVPTIALKKFGPGDYVIDRKTGLLIRNEVSALVHALTELLGDQVLRNHLGRTAQKDAKRFSVRATSERLVEVYNETIRTQAAHKDLAQ